MATTMPEVNRQRLLVLVIDGLIAVICVIGVYHVSQKAGIPVVLDEYDAKIRCVEVLDPSYARHIAPGEFVRAVAGYEIRHMEDVEFLLDAKQIGEMIEFEIEHEGQRRSAILPLTSFYTPVYLATASLVGFLFYLVGLLVFLRRPDDEAARLFHWGALSAACMMLVTWGRYTIEPVALGIGLRAVFFLSHTLLPVLFFHFTLVFPHPKWALLRMNIFVLYAVAVFLALWSTATFFQAAGAVSMDLFANFLKVFFASRWFLVVVGILALLSIAHSYRIAGEVFERKKLRWVLWGLLIGFPPYMLLWVVPQMVIKRGLVPEEVVLLLSGIVPISFGISIVRYRLMDIDLIINRSIVYALVMGVVLGFYATIVGLSALLVTSSTVESSVLISAMAAVVVALMFEPLRARVQRMVDSRFFRVQYDFRETQKKFFEEIRNAFDVQRLADVIVQRVEELFAVERVGLFTVTGARLKLLSHRNYDILASHGVRFEAEKLTTTLRLPVALAEKMEPGIAFEKADAGIFLRWGMAVVCAMLSEGGQVLGFLVLGPKKSGARFTAEDMDLLTSVSAQTGLAIERINLQHRVLLEHAETQRLEELNRLKSYFVSSVSHELKTPLTSIKMFAEMLLQGKSVPKKQLKEYLEIIGGESERLTRLINNVLDFAKVERGIMEYRFADVQLNDIVRQVLRSLKYQFRMEHCTLKTRLQKKMATVRGDADAIAEALINIISNAMKYSRTKKNVTISTFRRNGYAVVRVDDRGIGIARNDLKNVFEPFYRSKDVRGGQAGGAGLGLALVKHMIEAHGGKVEVHSSVGKGSSFTLKFPLGGTS